MSVSTTIPRPSHGFTSHATGGKPSAVTMTFAIPNWSLKIHAIMIEATTGATMSGKTISVRTTIRPGNGRFSSIAIASPSTTPPVTDAIMKPKVFGRTTPRNCPSERIRAKLRNPTNGCSSSVRENRRRLASTPMRMGTTWKTSRMSAAGATSVATKRRRSRNSDAAASPRDGPPPPSVSTWARPGTGLRPTPARPPTGAARLLHHVRELLGTLGQDLGDVLAPADERLRRDVGEGRVHLGPLLEVVRRHDVVRRIEQDRLHLHEERVLLRQRRLGLGDRRDARGRLPDVPLDLLGVEHPAQERLGELLLLRRDGLGHCPEPRRAPRQPFLGRAGPEREAAHRDLPGHLRGTRVVVLAVERRVVHGHERVARHEDPVRLRPRVAHQRRRRDLVDVDVVPPELDRLARTLLAEH